jgi:hypothetical protein
MKKFLGVLALGLCVATAVTAGDSYAQTGSRAPGKKSPIRPLAFCGGGCTTTLQCAAVCGGIGNAVCEDHRCVPV